MPSDGMSDREHGESGPSERLTAQDRAPRDTYAQRIEANRIIDESCAQRDRWTSRARGATFLLSAMFAYLGFVGGPHRAWAYVAAALGFVGFVGLVILHEQIRETSHRARVRGKINRIQRARLDRCWHEIPEYPIDVPREHESLSNDLDLFGQASVYQFTCRAHTPMGQECLRDWLLLPAAPEEIHDRNEAVARLAPLLDFREELDLRGRLLAASQSGPKAFTEWAEGERWLEKRAWLKWTTRGLAITLWASVAVGITGLISPESAFVACVVVALASMCVNLAFVPPVHEIFDRVDSRNNDIGHYRKLFELIGDLPQDCRLLGRLQSQMGPSLQAPLRLLGRLARIMKCAQIRRSAIFGLVHVPIQILTLLDFHVLWLLERWQRQNGSLVRPWFDAIAELEALASLASLVHDHPDWAFARLEAEGPRIFDAASLGHPLLPDNLCVRNDVQIGPPGEFLLVTGSNMSGKSTLLRALGVNVVLAQAGGPVCASRCSMPPLEIATSMRIRDSLQDGVSFFMAELRRLKQIVDRASRLSVGSRTTLFFLLDEVLQGTNSVERHIAVSRVVQHLIQRNATGAISTHDLELAKSPKLTPHCQPVHFRESIVQDRDGQKMIFDYQMRPGLATTTNALKLLELVGIKES